MPAAHPQRLLRVAQGPGKRRDVRETGGQVRRPGAETLPQRVGELSWASFRVVASAWNQRRLPLQVRLP